MTSETVFPGLDDLSVEKLMAGYSKRRLAETIAVNQRQMDQVSRELATAQEEARILTAQRDRLLDFLQVESPEASRSGARYTSWTINRCLEILTTDPRDEENHGK